MRSTVLHRSLTQAEHDSVLLQDPEQNATSGAIESIITELYKHCFENKEVVMKEFIQDLRANPLLWWFTLPWYQVCTTIKHYGKKKFMNDC